MNLALSEDQIAIRTLVEDCHDRFDETAPQPLASEVWSPHCLPGEEGATLRAPMTEETIDVAPLVMIEAIATWGLQPWDLALVFGAR